MFNIGFSELMVIGVIALLVIGPKQLPEVARVAARLLGELKKATQELSGGLLEVTRDVKSTINETKEDLMKEGRKMADDMMAVDDRGQKSDQVKPEKSEEELDGKK